MKFKILFVLYSFNVFGMLQNIQISIQNEIMYIQSIHSMRKILDGTLELRPVLRSRDEK